ncbi:hypothetical protein GGX14DRAFT_538049 [Mycena pura]|uniref:C2H2-type domain-containing protein n=1 Tax=Mycena pura TaxID=153505 RepID=A0AAD6UTY5_9AGAR|nr:hypothetical protein GGX14DRAFT_538049 [Mycena pura]
MSTPNMQCPACRRWFVGTNGRLKHWRQTRNTGCIAHYESTLPIAELSDNELDPPSPALSALSGRDSIIDYNDFLQTQDDDVPDLALLPPDSDDDDSDAESVGGWELPVDAGPGDELEHEMEEDQEDEDVLPADTTPGDSAEARFLQKPFVIKYGGDAGKKVKTELEEDEIWGPFRSQLDWEVARWAKLRGSTSTALTDLLDIPGVVDKLGLSYRNSRELNHIIDQNLPSGRPIFERHEVKMGSQVFDVFFRPILGCLYTDVEKTDRMYYDIHTGKWWWGTQKAVDELKPGGTIPSRQAYILVGYLPTTRLEHIKNKAARRRAMANLYHACLRKILEPLEDVGYDGIEWKTGVGDVHRCHPIFAIFGGDYPEQCLVTGAKYGECCVCPCPAHELGDFKVMYEPRDLDAALAALAKADGNIAEFTRACREAGIKPLFRPFWEKLPFCNIFLCITPDILHQILQGVLKHVFNWVKDAYGPEEIDARCRRLPPNHNVRLFLKGVSNLSRISGTEHGHIARILLGLIVDLRLPGGQSPARLVRAVRAILDFLYLSQYPMHTTATLKKLDNALDRFHANKDIFIILGIRDHFNLPKLHNISHQSMFIKLYGTADNYNTEYTERLHIDFAKDAYRASNRKDEYFQMTLWLERKEKVLWHEKFIRWRRFGAPSPPDRHRHIEMTKAPSVNGIRLDTLSAKYGIDDFESAFAKYAVTFNNPNYSRYQVAVEVPTFVLPFQTVSAFHKVRFWIDDPFGRVGAPQVLDVLHAKPGYRDRRGRTVGGRFDTALVNLGSGEHIGVSGYQVARVRMVFTLTERAISATFPNRRPPKHLAYVEFFSKPPSILAKIIPVDDLRRSIHLFPKFGHVAPREWTSETVLDLCSTFYASPWSDRHVYITVP